MKYVKILGLAAVAAMALMAFSVGIASATTLDGPNGTPLPAGTTILASLKKGESAVLKGGGITLDTCTAGTVHGVTNQESAEEITGSATLVWGQVGTECTQTTDTLKGGTIGITWISGTNNGTLRSYNAEVTVLNKELGVSCVYGTASTGTDLGTLVAGTPAELKIETTGLEKKSGSFLCPSSTEWKATYVVTTPSTLKVTN